MFNVPLYVKSPEEVPLAYELALLVSNGKLREVLDSYKNLNKKVSIEPEESPKPTSMPTPTPPKSPALNLYAIVEESCSCYDCFANFGHSSRMRWRHDIRSTTKGCFVTCKHARKGSFIPCEPVAREIAQHFFNIKRQSQPKAKFFQFYHNEVAGYIYDVENKKTFKDIDVSKETLTKADKIKLVKMSREADTSIAIAQMNIDARRQDKEMERQSRKEEQTLKEDAEEAARAKVCNDILRVRCQFCNRFKPTKPNKYCCHREHERARLDGETNYGT